MKFDFFPANQKNYDLPLQQPQGQNQTFHEESLCPTEENRFQNDINPIKLAGFVWGDDHKLERLVKLQQENILLGNIDED